MFNMKKFVSSVAAAVPTSLQPASQFIGSMVSPLASAPSSPGKSANTAGTAASVISNKPQTTSQEKPTKSSSFQAVPQTTSQQQRRQQQSPPNVLDLSEFSYEERAQIEAVMLAAAAAEGGEFGRVVTPSMLTAAPRRPSNMSTSSAEVDLSQFTAEERAQIEAVIEAAASADHRRKSSTPGLLQIQQQFLQQQQQLKQAEEARAAAEPSPQTFRDKKSDEHRFPRANISSEPIAKPKPTGGFMFPVEDGPDLSGLTEEEKAQIEAVMRAAAADRENMPVSPLVKQQPQRLPEPIKPQGQEPDDMFSGLTTPERDQIQAVMMKAETTETYAPSSSSRVETAQDTNFDILANAGRASRMDFEQQKEELYRSPPTGSASQRPGAFSKRSGRRPSWAECSVSFNEATLEAVEDVEGLTAEEIAHFQSVVSKAKAIDDIVPSRPSALAAVSGSIDHGDSDEFESPELAKPSKSSPSTESADSEADDMAEDEALEIESVRRQDGGKRKLKQGHSQRNKQRKSSLASRQKMKSQVSGDSQQTAKSTSTESADSQEETLSEADLAEVEAVRRMGSTKRRKGKRAAGTPKKSQRPRKPESPKKQRLSATQADLGALSEEERQQIESVLRRAEAEPSVPKQQQQSSSFTSAAANIFGGVVPPSFTPSAITSNQLFKGAFSAASAVKSSVISAAKAPLADMIVESISSGQKQQPEEQMAIDEPDLSHLSEAERAQIAEVMQKASDSGIASASLPLVTDSRRSSARSASPVDRRESAASVKQQAQPRQPEKAAVDDGLTKAERQHLEEVMARAAQMDQQMPMQQSPATSRRVSETTTIGGFTLPSAKGFAPKGLFSAGLAKANQAVKLAKEKADDAASALISVQEQAVKKLEEVTTAQVETREQQREPTLTAAELAHIEAVTREAELMSVVVPASTSQLDQPPAPEKSHDFFETSAQSSEYPELSQREIEHLREIEKRAQTEGLFTSLIFPEAKQGETAKSESFSEVSRDGRRQSDFEFYDESVAFPPDEEQSANDVSSSPTTDDTVYAADQYKTIGEESPFKFASAANERELLKAYPDIDDSASITEQTFQQLKEEQDYSYDDNYYEEQRELYQQGQADSGYAPDGYALDSKVESAGYDDGSYDNRLPPKPLSPLSLLAVDSDATPPALSPRRLNPFLNEPYFDRLPGETEKLEATQDVADHQFQRSEGDEAVGISDEVYYERADDRDRRNRDRSEGYYFDDENRYSPDQTDDINFPEQREWQQEKYYEEEVYNEGVGQQDEQREELFSKPIQRQQTRTWEDDYEEELEREKADRFELPQSYEQRRDEEPIYYDDDRRYAEYNKYAYEEPYDVENAYYRQDNLPQQTGKSAGSSEYDSRYQRQPEPISEQQASQIDYDNEPSSGSYEPEAERPEDETSWEYRTEELLGQDGQPIREDDDSNLDRSAYIEGQTLGSDQLADETGRRSFDTACTAGELDISESPGVSDKPATPAQYAYQYDDEFSEHQGYGYAADVGRHKPEQPEVFAEESRQDYYKRERDYETMPEPSLLQPPMPMSTTSDGGASSDESDIDIILSEQHKQMLDSYNELLTEGVHKKAAFETALDEADITAALPVDSEYQQKSEIIVDVSPMTTVASTPVEYRPPQRAVEIKQQQPSSSTETGGFGSLFGIKSSPIQGMFDKITPTQPKPQQQQQKPKQQPEPQKPSGGSGFSFGGFSKMGFGSLASSVKSQASSIASKASSTISSAASSAVSSRRSSFSDSAAATAADYQSVSDFGPSASASAGDDQLDLSGFTAEERAQMEAVMAKAAAASEVVQSSPALNKPQVEMAFDSGKPVAIEPAYQQGPTPIAQQQVEVFQAQEYAPPVPLGTPGKPAVESKSISWERETTAPQVAGKPAAAEDWQVPEPQMQTSAVMSQSSAFHKLSSSHTSFGSDLSHAETEDTGYSSQLDSGGSPEERAFSPVDQQPAISAMVASFSSSIAPFVPETIVEEQKSDLIEYDRYYSGAKYSEQQQPYPAVIEPGEAEEGEEESKGRTSFQPLWAQRERSDDFDSYEDEAEDNFYKTKKQQTQQARSYNYRDVETHKPEWKPEQMQSYSTESTTQQMPSIAISEAQVAEATLSYAEPFAAQQPQLFQPQQPDHAAQQQQPQEPEILRIPGMPDLDLSQFNAEERAHLIAMFYKAQELDKEAPASVSPSPSSGRIAQQAKQPEVESQQVRPQKLSSSNQNIVIPVIREIQPTPTDIKLPEEEFDEFSVDHQELQQQRETSSSSAGSSGHFSDVSDYVQAAGTQPVYDSSDVSSEFMDDEEEERRIREIEAEFAIYAENVLSGVQSNQNVCPLCHQAKLQFQPSADGQRPIVGQTCAECGLVACNKCGRVVYNVKPERRQWVCNMCHSRRELALLMEHQNQARKERSKSASPAPSIQATASPQHVAPYQPASFAQEQLQRSQAEYDRDQKRLEQQQRQQQLDEQRRQEEKLKRQVEEEREKLAKEEQQRRQAEFEEQQRRRQEEEAARWRRQQEEKLAAAAAEQSRIEQERQKQQQKKEQQASPSQKPRQQPVVIAASSIPELTIECASPTSTSSAEEEILTPLKTAKKPRGSDESDEEEDAAADSDEDYPDEIIEVPTAPSEYKEDQDMEPPAVSIGQDVLAEISMAFPSDFSDLPDFDSWTAKLQTTSLSGVPATTTASSQPQRAVSTTTPSTSESAAAPPPIPARSQPSQAPPSVPAVAPRSPLHASAASPTPPSEPIPPLPITLSHNNPFLDAKTIAGAQAGPKPVAVAGGSAQPSAGPTFPATSQYVQQALYSASQAQQQPQSRSIYDPALATDAGGYTYSTQGGFLEFQDDDENYKDDEQRDREEEEELDMQQAAKYYHNAQFIMHAPGPVYTIPEDEDEDIEAQYYSDSSRAGSSARQHGTIEIPSSEDEECSDVEDLEWKFKVATKEKFAAGGSSGEIADEFVLAGGYSLTGLASSAMTSITTTIPITTQARHSVASVSGTVPSSVRTSTAAPIAAPGSQALIYQQQPQLPEQQQQKAAEYEFYRQQQAQLEHERRQLEQQGEQLRQQAAYQQQQFQQLQLLQQQHLQQQQQQQSKQQHMISVDTQQQASAAGAKHGSGNQQSPPYSPKDPMFAHFKDIEVPPHEHHHHPHHQAQSPSPTTKTTFKQFEQTAASTVHSYFGQTQVQLPAKVKAEEPSSIVPQMQQEVEYHTQDKILTMTVHSRKQPRKEEKVIYATSLKPKPKPLEISQQQPPQQQLQQLSTAQPATKKAKGKAPHPDWSPISDLSPIQDVSPSKEEADADLISASSSYDNLKKLALTPTAPFPSVAMPNSQPEQQEAFENIAGSIAALSKTLNADQLAELSSILKSAGFTPQRLQQTLNKQSARQAQAAESALRQKQPLAGVEEGSAAGAEEAASLQFVSKLKRSPAMILHADEEGAGDSGQLSESDFSNPDILYAKLKEEALKLHTASLIQATALDAAVLAKQRHPSAKSSTDQQGKSQRQLAEAESITTNPFLRDFQQRQQQEQQQQPQQQQEIQQEWGTEDDYGLGMGRRKLPPVPQQQQPSTASPFFDASASLSAEQQQFAQQLRQPLYQSTEQLLSAALQYQQQQQQQLQLPTRRTYGELDSQQLFLLEQQHLLSLQQKQREQALAIAQQQTALATTADLLQRQQQQQQQQQLPSFADYSSYILSQRPAASGLPYRLPSPQQPQAYRGVSAQQEQKQSQLLTVGPSQAFVSSQEPLLQPTGATKRKPNRAADIYASLTASSALTGRKISLTLARVLLKQELKENLAVRRNALEATEIEANQREYNIKQMLLGRRYARPNYDDLTPRVVRCDLPLELVAGAQIVPKQKVSVGTQKSTRKLQQLPAQTAMAYGSPTGMHVGAVHSSPQRRRQLPGEPRPVAQQHDIGAEIAALYPDITRISSTTYVPAALQSFPRGTRPTPLAASFAAPKSIPSVGVLTMRDEQTQTPGIMDTDQQFEAEYGLPAASYPFQPTSRKPYLRDIGQSFSDEQQRYEEDARFLQSRQKSVATTTNDLPVSDQEISRRSKRPHHRRRLYSSYFSDDDDAQSRELRRTKLQAEIEQRREKLASLTDLSQYEKSPVDRFATSRQFSSNQTLPSAEMPQYGSLPRNIEFSLLRQQQQQQQPNQWQPSLLGSAAGPMLDQQQRQSEQLLQRSDRFNWPDGSSTMQNYPIDDRIRDPSIGLSSAKYQPMFRSADWTPQSIGSSRGALDRPALYGANVGYDPMLRSRSAQFHPATAEPDYSLYASRYRKPQLSSSLPQYLDSSAAAPLAGRYDSLLSRPPYGQLPSRTYDSGYRYEPAKVGAYGVPSRLPSAPGTTRQTGLYQPDLRYAPATQRQPYLQRQQQQMPPSIYASSYYDSEPAPQDTGLLSHYAHYLNQQFDFAQPSSYATPRSYAEDYGAVGVHHPREFLDPAASFVDGLDFTSRNSLYYDGQRRQQPQSRGDPYLTAYDSLYAPQMSREQRINGPLGSLGGLASQAAAYPSHISYGASIRQPLSSSYRPATAASGYQTSYPYRSSNLLLQSSSELAQPYSGIIGSAPLPAAQSPYASQYPQSYPPPPLSGLRDFGDNYPSAYSGRSFSAPTTPYSNSYQRFRNRAASRMPSGRDERNANAMGIPLQQTTDPRVASQDPYGYLQQDYYPPVADAYSAYPTRSYESAAGRFAATPFISSSYQQRLYQQPTTTSYNVNVPYFSDQQFYASQYPDYYPDSSARPQLYNLRNNPFQLQNQQILPHSQRQPYAGSTYASLNRSKRPTGSQHQPHQPPPPPPNTAATILRSLL